MSKTWAASGRKPAPRQTERAFGSWEAAVDRARRSWDDLTGGPGIARRSLDGTLPAGPRYSDAAAAILSTALGLWSDTAAGMTAGDSDGEG